MALLTSKRREAPTAPVRGVGAPAAERGYVTDGRRLFRVIAPIDPERGLHSAVLEDCSTLVMRVYSATELWWLGLRRVRGTGDVAGL